MTVEIDKNLLLKTIKKINRPFHSEADFQHALAIELDKQKIKNIRLEVPLKVPVKFKPITYKKPEKKFTHDILINDEIIIELKYKQFRRKKDESIEWNGEKFDLSNHSAEDLGFVHFWLDVKRIELQLYDENKNIKKGFAIFITNNKFYYEKNWESKDKNTCYYEFSTNPSRTNITGKLTTKPNGCSAIKSSIRSFNKSIYNDTNNNLFFELENKYSVEWYSFKEEKGLENFSVLIIEINKNLKKYN